MEAKPIEKGGTRMVHVGKTIVNALEAQGVERTFIVPGAVSYTHLTLPTKA